jgi:hypothetical protein
MIDTTEAHYKEASLFCRYLIDQPLADNVFALYDDIIKTTTNDNQADTSDRLLRFAIEHPWSLAFLDSAAAVVRPESELRRRLHVMFAILECQPSYSSYFLSVAQPSWYVIVIGFTGCKAVLKALCGVALIKAIRA